MYKSITFLIILSLVIMGAGCAKKTTESTIDTSNLINSFNQPTTNNQNLNQPEPTNENQNTNTDTTTNININSNTNNSQLNIEESEEESVEIENFVFNPVILTVKAGTIITWVNKDSTPHQIASNPHPEHTDLPGLASEVLATGESYSYTFITPGTFGYHCHLHPSMKGTIVVE